MITSISKTATAGVLAFAIAVTSLGASATPARANDDAAAIIGGIIALYAISRAIDIRNDNRSRAQAHTPPPRVHNPPHRRLVAPQRCHRTYHTDNGIRRGYGYRCMQNHVARPARLPDQCIRRVHTDRGIRNFYAGRCLTRNGWERG